MIDLHDRARGALLGLAAGDALGTTVEFSPPGSFEPLTDIVGGGPFRLKAGQWTDDTSMALCLAESLLARAGFDPVDQLQRYVRWYREGHHSSTGRCFDIGNTVRDALERFERTHEPRCGRTDPQSAGNGSLMRLAPVPLFYWRSPEEAIARAADSSRTTHGAREAVDACRYYCALIVGALNGVAKEELLSPMFTPVPGFWDREPLAAKIEEVARGSFLEKGPPDIKGTGYVVKSMEAALWAFARSSTFTYGALLAVNLGDDADTTGAIYGQLAGAYYGVQGIPPHWLERLAQRELIEDMAMRLAAENARTEDPPPVPFPGSYWLVEGQLLAGEYPGHDDETLAREKLEQLLGAGIRSVIDLTETSDPLDPYEELLTEVAEARSLDVRYQRLPIRDMDIPTSDRMTEILSLIASEVAAGRPVYVHCWGGIGRTGTVAACWLVEQGHTCDAALARLKELRARTPDARTESPQTDAQRRFVRAWPRRNS